MKKLYVNIEDIHIKGDISELSRPVKQIDFSLQAIAENTNRITDLLAKYSSFSKGKQFENIVRESFFLRNELYEAALNLNQIQNELVEYQNKIYRYEGMSNTAERPNPFYVKLSQITVETTGVQVNRRDMESLVKKLNDYLEGVGMTIRDILTCKNEMASIWLDTQYNDFSLFIDDITKTIFDSLKGYRDYVVYLSEKLKELE